jgi:hypothetical protein
MGRALLGTQTWRSFPTLWSCGIPGPESLAVTRNEQLTGGKGPSEEPYLPISGAGLMQVGLVGGACAGSNAPDVPRALEHERVLGEWTNVRDDRSVGLES